MPIFFEKDINACTKLGIWHIAEEENFFLHKVLPQRNVMHPHKRLQHLAGRYLLKYLFPDFPTELIKLADTRKPFLEDEAYHFSISHCGDYAAAIVSKANRVGVDIEVPVSKINKIKHKFLSVDELLIVHRTAQPEEASELFTKHITLCWSCKEAVYKWYGTGEVDFKEHMVIENLKQLSATDFRAEICFRKKEITLLKLDCSLFKEIVLSYVLT